MDKIEHAKYSHQNITETLRFVDGKTAGLAAFTTALTAVSFYLIRLLTGIGSETPVEPLSCLIACAVIAILFSLIAAAGSVICCVMVNVARQRSTTGFVVLFPIHKSKEMDQKKDQIKQLLDSMDDETVLDEFADQLTNLGRILAAKMFYFKRACYCFIAQVVAAITGVLLLAVNWLAS
jgi:hypothetical protein